MWTRAPCSRTPGNGWPASAPVWATEWKATPVAAERNTVEAGRAVAEHILGWTTIPTAIAAVSDVLALGVIDTLRSRGLTVGSGGVSVTGFDDVPAAAAADLTTVRQPVREKGRTMGRMLLDPSFVGQRVVLPTETVVRGSTGRARRPPRRCSPEQNA